MLLRPQPHYYVDPAGKNTKTLAEYIQNQLKEDLSYEQMSMKDTVHG